MKFILAIFNAWFVISALWCNTMCWLMTMECCGTMEFRPTIDCASFWVLMCLVGEALHSGAILCARRTEWKFHQYIYLNIIMFLLSFEFCS